MPTARAAAASRTSNAAIDGARAENANAR